MAGRAKRADESSCDVGHGDQYFSADVMFASVRVISIRISNWEYCHGTPHGHGGTNSFTYLTEPAIRPLEASDLFERGSGWEDFLGRRSYEAIVKKAKGAKVDEHHVGNVAVDVHRWTLTKNGLLLTFDPYELLSYARGTTEVVIPWSDLAPFLAAHASIPR